MCCDILPIKILNKPDSVKCKYSDGKRCLIYPTRPISCKNYFCYWTLNDNLNENLRPDKCGVIFEEVKNTDIILAITDHRGIVQKNKELLLEFTNSLLSKGRPVIVTSYTNAPKYFLTPKGITELEVKAELEKSIRENYT